MISSAENITDELHRLASHYGFDVCGCAPAQPVKKADYFIHWTQKQYHASMKWFENSLPRRLDPTKVFPQTQSVCVFGINYYRSVDFTASTDTAKISRYAWGMDYHFVVKKKLEKILEDLEHHFPNLKGKCFTDTAPIAEKYWAVQAGLGWQGKHSIIISPVIGSWMFLGVILLNHPLVYDHPLPDLCSDCRQCIYACPTGAIIEPYLVDARRCLSWATIEHPDNHFPEYLTPHHENWIYGCDRCQEICPWNQKLQKETNETAFQPIHREIRQDDFKTMTENDFKKRYQHSAILRIGYRKFQRNGKAIFQ